MALIRLLFDLDCLFRPYRCRIGLVDLHLLLQVQFLISSKQNLLFSDASPFCCEGEHLV